MTIRSWKRMAREDATGVPATPDDAEPRVRAPARSATLARPMPFKLQAPYQPTGDQPQAIEELIDGVRRGDRYQTLLGATGSGKTYSVSNVIAAINKPTLIISHNKTLA